jgi:hypothetical protein
MYCDEKLIKHVLPSKIALQYCTYNNNAMIVNKFFRIACFFGGNTWFQNLHHFLAQQRSQQK